MICPHCSGCIQECGIEPLYSIAEAVRLIPLHYTVLMGFLQRYKAEYPALYQDSVLIEARNKRTHRRIRLLSASEIKRIRAKYLNGPALSRVT